MHVDFVELCGLVGVTLFITAGKWLDDLRDWLCGFEVRANPLRLLGEVMSSTLFVGFVVGLVRSWGMPYQISFAGLVALASYFSDEALALMHALVRKLMPRSSSRQQFQVAQPGAGPRLVRSRGEEGLSEDEAHAVVDREDEENEGGGRA